MARLKELMIWIDALSFRERGLILLILLFALYGLWDTLLMQPLNVKQEKLTNQNEQIHKEVQGLQLQAQTIVDTHGVDPNALNRAKLEELQKQLDTVKAELKQSTEHLISPQDMAKVLESVLKQSGELNFVKLEGLGVKPLVNEGSVVEIVGAEQGESLSIDKEKSLPDKQGQSPDKALQTAYMHGLRMEFEGGYLDTLDYLRKLEALPWAFFWDSVDFKVEKYPKALGSITVYTLSLDANWIGV
ncbi:MAG: hypothetical protein L0Z68_08920 [Gammaproteobacteria bacterium]|nr:hypothetical protein [Gammaproteobacteria bacterium]